MVQDRGGVFVAGLSVSLTEGADSTAAAARNSGRLKFARSASGARSSLPRIKRASVSSRTSL
ncbi:MAG: hypothetical protein ABSG83_10795 [Roseiarcus sp.]